MELLTLLLAIVCLCVALKFTLGKSLSKVDDTLSDYLTAGQVHANKLIAEQDEEKIVEQIKRANAVKELLKQSK